MNETSRGRGRPKDTKKLRDAVRITLVVDRPMYEYLVLTADRESQGNVSHLVRKILAEELVRRTPSARFTNPGPL